MRFKKLTNLQMMEPQNLVASFIHSHVEYITSGSAIAHLPSSLTRILSIQRLKGQNTLPIRNTQFRCFNGIKLSGEKYKMKGVELTVIFVSWKYLA